MYLFLLLLCPVKVLNKVVLDSALFKLPPLGDGQSSGALASEHTSPTGRQPPQNEPAPICLGGRSQVRQHLFRVLDEDVDVCQAEDGLSLLLLFLFSHVVVVEHRAQLTARQQLEQLARPLVGLALSLPHLFAPTIGQMKFQLDLLGEYTAAERALQLFACVNGTIWAIGQFVHGHKFVADRTDNCK